MINIERGEKNEKMVRVESHSFYDYGIIRDYLFVSVYLDGILLFKE